MKISRWTLLWLLIVGLLTAIELAIVFGAVNPYDVVTFFFIMVSRSSGPRSSGSTSPIGSSRPGTSPRSNKRCSGWRTR